jgi:hypothetical protein
LAVAEKPAVVDVPHGKGHVVLFANNPMWRNKTMGSYWKISGPQGTSSTTAVGEEEEEN